MSHTMSQTMSHTMSHRRQKRHHAADFPRCRPPRRRQLRAAPPSFQCVAAGMVRFVFILHVHVHVYIIRWWGILPLFGCGFRKKNLCRGAARVAAAWTAVSDAQVA